MSSGTRLYLDFTPARTSDGGSAALSAALDAGPIASLLIRPAAGQPYHVESTRSLIAMAQKKSIATLVLNDASLIAALGADGVHVSWSGDVVQQYKSVRTAAGPAAIVGADAGRTRHDAMEIGEGNADYVAFGIPSHVEDRTRAAERQLDLIAWWSNVFEIPCVAFDVADAEHARRLAEAGADFIAVTLAGDVLPSDAAAYVRGFSEAISVHEDAE